MKGRFRSTESKQKLRCRDAHGEDCSLHVFERPVKPLTDPMLHNGQVPTRHEMLILGGFFLLPSRQAMRDVCFGEMLGCELQFSPAIGGKDWKN